MFRRCYMCQSFYIISKQRQMSNYSDKLKSPKWQKKRLEILTRDEFTCCNCGDTERTLHIHHQEYIKGKEPWDYTDEYLTTLCDVCHKIHHLLNTEFEKFAYDALIARDRDKQTELRIAMRSLVHLLLLNKINHTGNPKCNNLSNG